MCGFAWAIAVSDGLCGAAEVARSGVTLLSRDACLCASRSRCNRLGVLPVFGPGLCVKVCVVLRLGAEPVGDAVSEWVASAVSGSRVQ